MLRETRAAAYGNIKNINLNVILVILIVCCRKYQMQAIVSK